MTDDKVVSDGPYTFADIGDGFAVFGPTVVPRSHKMSQWYCGSEKSCADKASALNSAYTEGRKAAESYTEKMLKLATDEVRKCHEEIRRLQDKYARNFYRMPLSLDEEFAKKARGIE